MIGELGEGNSVLTVRGNGQGIRTENQVSSEHVQLMAYNDEVGSVWEWRIELIGIALHNFRSWTNHRSPYAWSAHG